MDVFRKAPNIVIVCVAVLVGMTIAAVTLLVAIGRNPAEIERLINVILTGLAALAGSGALLYSGAAKETSSNVEKQLNGQFDARLHDAIQTALKAHDKEVHGIGGD